MMRTYVCLFNMTNDRKNEQKRSREKKADEEETLYRSIHNNKKCVFVSFSDSVTGTAARGNSKYKCTYIETISSEQMIHFQSKRFTICSASTSTE